MAQPAKDWSLEGRACGPAAAKEHRYQDLAVGIAQTARARGDGSPRSWASSVGPSIRLRDGRSFFLPSWTASWTASSPPDGGKPVNEAPASSTVVVVATQRNATQPAYHASHPALLKGGLSLAEAQSQASRRMSGGQPVGPGRPRRFSHRDLLCRGDPAINLRNEIYYLSTAEGTALPFRDVGTRQKRHIEGKVSDRRGRPSRREDLET
jgi:hypothetical protein